MRGGAQCHLVEAAGDRFYVLKARNNPQHRRILVNEWLASEFLRYLRVPAPEAAILDITPELLAAEPGLAIQLGKSTVPVEPGWHFGSRFPGDPATTAVFNFLPDQLLAGVANRRDFLGAFVFDKWTSNADARQSIFFRAHVQSGSEDEPPGSRPGYVARMIDHGFIFEGPNWTLGSAPLQGLYHRRSVYAQVSGWRDWEPWIEWVRSFPEQVADSALAGIPADWLPGGDYEALTALLTQLMERRKRIADLIEDTHRAVNGLFPNWR